ELTARDVTSGTSVDQFASPPTLTLHYTPMEGVTPQIYYLDPVNGPTPIASTVDPEAMTVSAQLPHFSTYVAGTLPIPTGTDDDDTGTPRYDAASKNIVLEFAGTSSVGKNADVGGGILLPVTLGKGDDTLTIGDLGPFSGKLAIFGGDNPIADTLRVAAPNSTWKIAANGTGTVTIKTGTVPAGVVADFQGFEAGSLTFTTANKADHVRVTQDSPTELAIEPIVAGEFKAAHVDSLSPAVLVKVETLTGSDVVLVDSLRTTLKSNLWIDTGDDNDSVTLLNDSTLALHLHADGGLGYDVLQDYTGLVPILGQSNFEVFPAGDPTFTEQGPGPINADPGAATNSDKIFNDQFPVAGAVQQVAVHPFSDQVMFLATVNAGVWQSTDGGVTWRTTTDQMPSLSIGSIAIAPRDNTGAKITAAPTAADLDKLVIYAGTGALSSFQFRGGFNVGILRSRDGGKTWTLLAPGDLSTVKITSIVPINNDARTTDANQIVLAAGDGGMQSSGWINYNDAFAAVQAALQSIGDIAGKVTVSAGPLPGVTSIKFDKSLGDVPQLLLGGSQNLTAGSKITIATTTQGVKDTTDEVQTIRITGTAPIAGRFWVDFSTGGVYRSDDSGNSFTRVLRGSATDLVADPGLPGRLYAAIVGGGVYRSDDYGVNWVQLVNGLTLVGDGADNDGNGRIDDAPEAGVGATRIRLAVLPIVSPTGTDQKNTVYAALLGNHLMGLFQSAPTPTGATTANWQQSAWVLSGPTPGPATAPPLPAAAVALTPATVGGAWPNANQQPQPNLGGQAAWHFALAVDAKGNIYMAGDIGLSAARVPSNIYGFVKKTGQWLQLGDQAAVIGTVRAHSDDRGRTLASAPRGASGHAY